MTNDASPEKKKQVKEKQQANTERYNKVDKW